MIALTIDQREANRRAMRAKIWAGVWRANGFSRGNIDALLRAEIDSKSPSARSHTDAEREGKPLLIDPAP